LCNLTHDQVAPPDETFELENLGARDGAMAEAALADMDFTSWSHLYVFADSFDIPLLREQLITQFWIKYSTKQKTPSYLDIVVSFDSLSASSPLWRLLVNASVRNWVATCDNKCAVMHHLRAKVPKDFYFAVAAKLSCCKGSRQGQEIGPLCQYHEHGQNSETNKQCTVKVQRPSPLRPILKAKNRDDVDLTTSHPDLPFPNRPYFVLGNNTILSASRADALWDPSNSDVLGKRPRLCPPRLPSDWSVVHHH
jgi:hypothetical protein